jgi:hypothetical protein
VTSAPVVVVGGSVAALVAADALAAADRSVELFLPDRGVGGGFLPYEHRGRRLDLGPRVLELRYDAAVGEQAPTPPWATYRPGPHGHRPFLGAIDRFVRELAGDDLVQVPPAEVSVAGRRCSDYVLAGDLSGLGDVLDPETLHRLAEEARRRVEVEGPHGVFATEGGVPWDRSFRSVGRDQTGAAFHDLLIEPIAAKILSGGTGAVIAALHRKIWLPIFHPVTAWEACTGSLSYRPDRPFTSVAGGGMGEVVSRLLQRIGDAPTVTVRHEGALVGLGDGGGGVELRFGSGAAVTAIRPILAVGPEELFAAGGSPFTPERVTSTMVWLDLPEDRVRSLPSVLMSAEPDEPLLRVTESLADRRDGFRTVCCELAWWVEPEERAARAVAGLLALGVLASIDGVEVVADASRPAFSVPSAANLQAFQASRRDLDALGLPITVIGGARSFAIDSFNEQVVQGLAVAADRTA